MGSISAPCISFGLGLTSEDSKPLEPNNLTHYFRDNSYRIDSGRSFKERRSSFETTLRLIKTLNLTTRIWSRDNALQNKIIVVLGSFASLMCNTIETRG